MFTYSSSNALPSPPLIPTTTTTTTTTVINHRSTTPVSHKPSDLLFIHIIHILFIVIIDPQF
ncbi:hypothetical protein Hanom_Chr15g01406641 [Helianthus anomalus]